MSKNITEKAAASSDWTAVKEKPNTLKRMAWLVIEIQNLTDDRSELNRTLTAKRGELRNLTALMGGWKAVAK